MTALHLMAVFLHDEMLARAGAEVDIAECEAILRHVIDHAAAIQLAPLTPAGHSETRDRTD